MLLFMHRIHQVEVMSEITMLIMFTARAIDLENGDFQKNIGISIEKSEKKLLITKKLKRLSVLKQ